MTLRGQGTRGPGGVPLDQAGSGGWNPPALVQAQLLALAGAGYPVPPVLFKGQDLAPGDYAIYKDPSSLPNLWAALQLLYLGRGEAYSFVTKDRTQYSDGQTLTLTLLNAGTLLFDPVEFIVKRTAGYTPPAGPVVVDLSVLASDSALLVIGAWLQSINNLGGGATYWAQFYPVFGDAVTATLTMRTIVGDERQNSSTAPSGTVIDPARFTATPGYDSSDPIFDLASQIDRLVALSQIQAALSVLAGQEVPLALGAAAQGLVAMPTQANIHNGDTLTVGGYTFVAWVSGASPTPGPMQVVVDLRTCTTAQTVQEAYTATIDSTPACTVSATGI